MQKNNAFFIEIDEKQIMGQFNNKGSVFNQTSLGVRHRYSMLKEPLCYWGVGKHHVIGLSLLISKEYYAKCVLLYVHALKICKDNFSSNFQSCSPSILVSSLFSYKKFRLLLIHYKPRQSRYDSRTYKQKNRSWIKLEWITLYLIFSQ